MKGSAESPGGLEELLVLKFSQLATECLELDMSRKWVMARSTKPDNGVQNEVQHRNSGVSQS